MTKAKAMRDTPTEAMIAEFERHKLGKPATEYGRGWNCGLEQAVSIAMQAARSEIPDGREARLREMLERLLDYTLFHDSALSEGSPIVIACREALARSETPVQDDDAEGER